MNTGMDIFIEHMVQKKVTAIDQVKMVLLTLAAVLLIFLLMILSANIKFLAMILLLAVFGVIWGWWVLLKRFRLEFEYSLTNGVIDVDKIIAKSRRKRVVSVDIHNIEVMAPMKSDHTADYPNVPNVIDASVSPEDPGAWFIVFSRENKGLTKLIFNPDDRIIDGAHMVSPRKVFKE